MCVISLYQNMNFVLYAIFCSTCLLTIESLTDEKIKALVQEAGEIFSYPETFQMENIELPPNTVDHISYGHKERNGFHLADILGYIVKSNIEECMAACHAYPSCKALNYVQSNRLCVLTKTACKNGAKIWNNPDVGSVHVYFTTGPNVDVEEHKPRNNGSRSLVLPGIAHGIFENEHHSFPWMVQVNDCPAILMPKTRDLSLLSIRSDLIILPANCLKHELNIAILGSYNAIVSEDTEVYLKVSQIAIHGKDNFVIAQLISAVEFNDYIRPVAIPTKPKPSFPDECKVVGWLKSVKLSMKSANLQILNLTDVDTSEPCLYSKNSEVEKVNIGSALLCPENVSGNRSAWTLYGIKVPSSSCPGRFVFPFFNMHYLLPYLENGAKFIAKPTEDDLIDLTAEIILQNGQDYSSPFLYKILPIDRDLVLEDVNIKPNDYDELNGFHFADVINYTKVDSKEDCMIACITAVGPCWAVNYVENNKWCVFLASAHKSGDNRYVGLWKSKNLSSWHIYFLYGPKKNPPRHQPLKRGTGIRLPTGLAPRMKMKGARISGGTYSTPLLHPWMAKINRNCGGALIENPIDNVNIKIRSDLILTAAHCVNMESRNGPDGISPSRVRIRLGVHRDDILEIAQDFHKAKKIVSHGGFDYQTKHNDIALIQLDELIDFSVVIGPISLPHEDMAVPASEPCKAMGWGREDIDKDGSKILKEVNLQVTNSCRSMDNAEMIKGNVFCTEPVDNVKDNICLGDSGGPFLCSKNLADGSSLSTIFGITSFGGGASCTDGYAGFANVSSLIGWLKKAVSKLGDQSDGTHEYYS